MALLTPICDQNTPSVQLPVHRLKETHHVGDGGVYVRALAAHRHLLTRLLVHGLDHLVQILLLKLPAALLGELEGSGDDARVGSNVAES